jgi:hypothetical protein
MFVMLGWFAWRTCGRIKKQAINSPEHKWMTDLAAMTQVSIAGYAASGAFLGLAYFDYFYHLVAISVILGQLANKIETSPAQPTARLRRPVRAFKGSPPVTPQGVVQRT